MDEAQNSKTELNHTRKSDNLAIVFCLQGRRHYSELGDTDIWSKASATATMQKSSSGWWDIIHLVCIATAIQTARRVPVPERSSAYRSAVLAGGKFRVPHYVTRGWRIVLDQQQRLFLPFSRDCHQAPKGWDSLWAHWYRKEFRTILYQRSGLASCRSCVLQLEL